MINYLILAIAILLLILTFFKNKWKSEDQEKKFTGLRDGQQIIQDDTKLIAGIDTKINQLIQNAEEQNPDIIAEARKRYIFGFIAFGYLNGKTIVRPYESRSNFRVSANWEAVIIDTDIRDDKVAFTFKDVSLTDGVWTVNFREYEHKHRPIRFNGRIRIGLTDTPSGYLIMELNAIYSKESLDPIYLVGFVLESDLTAPLEKHFLKVLEGVTFTPKSQ